MTDTKTERPPRLLCWAIEHNSHGLYRDTPIWLPEGDEPETHKNWKRMPWLDEPVSIKEGT